MELSNFRLPLIVCSVCALVGNILYSYSLKKASLVMACIGRILVGFGSAEILNRHLLSSILPPESINIEVAILAKLSMITTALALMIGSLFDLKVGEVHPFPVINTIPLIIPPAQPFLPSPSIMSFGRRNLFSLEGIGYVMAFSWFLYLIGMIFFFDIPKSKIRAECETHVISPKTAAKEDFDSDTETFDQEKNPPYASTENNPFSARTQEISHGDRTFEKL